MTKRNLHALCAVITVCLLASTGVASADTSITVPDFSFSSDNETGGTYANQYPVSYSPYPDAEFFPGWLSSSYNYQIGLISTSSATGTFNGPTAVEVSSPQTQVTEGLNPAVLSLAPNTTYTLTVALSSSIYVTTYVLNEAGNGYVPVYSTSPNAGDVVLQLLSTTSAPDTTDYSKPANVKGGANPTSEPDPSPIITTTDVLATKTISGATIDLQGAGNFVDYSLTFNTADFPSTAGQDMTIAIGVQYGNNTDFDNVRLTETPEPGTWAMMLGSAALLGFVGVRRKLA